MVEDYNIEQRESIRAPVVDEDFIESMQQYRTPKDKSMSLFEAARDNPVIFVEKMLGFELYAWEIDFLMHIKWLIEDDLDKDELAALTSRQIGKSFCLSCAAVWVSVFNLCPGTAHNNTIVGVVSASDRQAKELLREVKKLMIYGDRHMQEEYDTKDFFSNLLDPHGQNNTEIVSFKDETGSKHDLLLKGAKSGPQIMSYPPTAKVLGKSFTLIFIDEVGRTEAIPDDFIKEELMPTGAATKAKIVMTSTPWYPEGYFYRVVDPDKEYGESPAVVLKYTIDALKIEEEAKDQYEYVMKKIEQMRKDGDHDAIRRAYYCEFVKGENSFFDPDKVQGVFDRDYDEFSSYDGKCDIGVDFGGKVSSQTVITVSMMDEDGNIYRLYSKEYPVGEDDSLMDDLENDVMRRFPQWQRIIPDDAPVGEYLIREMKDKGWDVHEMNFRRDKMKKYGAFRAKINRGEVFSFPDSRLKSEMLGLQTNTGSRQSRIVAPRGGSDDRIDSWVMSVYFMVQEEKANIGVLDWDDL